MADAIPKNIDEFLSWMASKGFVLDEKTERVYSVNATNALSAVQKHPFFRDLDNYLAQCDREYYEHNLIHLLMNHSAVNLLVKSYKSVVDKCFRQNVLYNKKFPADPKHGLVTPDNWFQTINDILRSTIVCKYIDGPKHLSQLIKSYADSMSVACKFYSQERDAGYYAYHLYIDIPVDLVDHEFKQYSVSLKVELQIRTQLQDMMYDITHQFYEEVRTVREEDPNAWKWNVKSNRFRASYLSHTLHLLEGLILDLRDEKLDRPVTNIKSLGEETNE